jgi:hypothetical protein
MTLVLVTNAIFCFGALVETAVSEWPSPAGVARGAAKGVAMFVLGQIVSVSFTLIFRYEFHKQNHK